MVELMVDGRWLMDHPLALKSFLEPVRDSSEIQWAKEGGLGRQELLWGVYGDASVNLMEIVRVFSGLFKTTE